MGTQVSYVASVGASKLFFCFWSCACLGAVLDQPHTYIHLFADIVGVCLEQVQYSTVRRAMRHIALCRRLLHRTHGRL